MNRPLDHTYFDLFSGCWIWTGAKAKGYGRFLYQGRVHQASRWIYEKYFGQINDRKIFVCHKCDNRSCMNPSHLFLGSHLDNMKDMVNKKRHHMHINGGNLTARKFTKEQIISIRNRYALGNITMRDLAEIVGTDSSNLSRIISKKSYKNI